MIQTPPTHLIPERPDAPFPVDRGEQLPGTPALIGVGDCRDGSEARFLADDGDRRVAGRGSVRRRADPVITFANMAHVLYPGLAQSMGSGMQNYRVGDCPAYDRYVAQGMQQASSFGSINPRECYLAAQEPEAVRNSLYFRFFRYLMRRQMRKSIG